MAEQLDDRCRCLHCVNIVMEFFPKILQRIMEKSGICPKLLFQKIHADFNFKKKMVQSDYHTIQTLLNEGYTKLDVTLIFKIITHFSNMFIIPPTRGWSSDPQPSELTMGDDAQRIRIIRNHFFHKVETVLTEVKYNEFLKKVENICERFDTHLNLTECDKLTLLLSSYLVLPWNRLPEIEKQYTEQKSLKEFLVIEIGNRNFTIYQTGSMKELIQEINRRSEESSNAEAMEPITLTFPEITDSEVVKQVEEELKDEINSGLVNIRLNRVTDGSLVLHICVRKKVLINENEFKQELDLFIKRILTWKKLQSLWKMQIVMSEYYGFFEETDTVDMSNMSDAAYKPRGLKLHLEVKPIVLQSDEAFKEEIQHLLETMAIKTNGSGIFHSDPVKAILEPGTEESLSTRTAQVRVLKRHTLQRQLRLIKQINILGEVRDCTAIDNIYVMSDFPRCRLVICEKHSPNVRNIWLSGRPWMITAIDEKTVAVRITGDSMYIAIVDISTDKIIRIINVDSYVLGLAYSKGHLYVSFGFKFIKVFDCNGVVIRIIKTECNTRLLSISRNYIYYTDYNKIFCAKLSGEFKWKFDDPRIKNIESITTDNDENVYIGLYFSHSVFLLSPDKRVNQLLSYLDGLAYPRGICYNKENDTLLVCNALDPACLFDVVKETM